MLSHNTIKATPGSAKARMRVGRGNGSGKGTFAGRGCKGQNARTGGGKVKAVFEWGQSPLFRRMPKKRGFTAFDTVPFAPINVSQLQKLADAGITTIDNEVLFEKGIIRKKDALLKLLGNGEITQKVSIRIHRASKQAQDKVTAAGGTVELL
ncbi:MAG: hypothetical protein ACD_78C00367G0007 [uncultured bacterium (gcode 4)]|uniref:Large ribosomal subunit protein uL15 n=1 Tax=uncultured bacterium (gcode 4) TaxID=1234023 RepID=K1XW99_9BACT|nr:MAG: hypothetical protein ACD_78C00367G0007 [uncultured bacterium (gcode 4)]